MALDFPTSPALNEIYTYGGRSWQWNGTAWDVYSTVSGNVVTQLNGLTGGVTLAAGSNITLTPSGNTITIASSGGGGGISGPYVISFNGLTGAVTGVSSVRGLTGAVGITNGSGIGLSVSGQTMTFSNTGVLSFNGLTGTVTGLTSGSIGGTNGSILYKAASGISGTEYFTISSVPLSGYQNDLFSFVGPTSESVFSTNNGIKIQRWPGGLGLDEGGGSIIYAEGYDPANFGAASLWIAARDGSADDVSSSVRIGTYDGSATWAELASFTRYPTADDIFLCYATAQFANSASLLNKGSLVFFDQTNTNNITIQFSGVTLPASYVVTLPSSNTTLAGLATTQTFTGTNTFNTLTNFPGGISASGATFTGNISARNIVNSVRGLTGAVGITNGSGIGLSVSGQTMTFSNTGVLSIDGGTGAITNVARTNVTNNFTAIQSFSAGLSAAAFDVNTIAQPLSTASLYFDNIKLGDPNGDINSIYIELNNTSGYIDYVGTHVFNGSVNFSNSTVTGPLVNSINGKTGAINLVAGSGISLGVSGNTFTITSTASSNASGFTTSVDFSADINWIEFVAYGTGNDNGTSFQNFDQYTINSIYIESVSAIPGNITIVGTESFYDPTLGWCLRITGKAPYSNDPNFTSEEVINFGNITALEISLTTSSNFTFVDTWLFTATPILLHKQATYVVKSITGQSWVAADSFITCKVMGLTSADHTAEDAIVEGVNFEINNINPGVGFDIMGYAPEGTYGKYTVKCLGE